jgi:hypothetical protein
LELLRRLALILFDEGGDSTLGLQGAERLLDGLVINVGEIEGRGA